MPNKTDDERQTMQDLILAALKAGMDSPRKVQQWIDENGDIESPSIPTIAGVMRGQGYEPVGFKWEKKRK